MRDLANTPHRSRSRFRFVLVAAPILFSTGAEAQSLFDDYYNLSQQIEWNDFADWQSFYSGASYPGCTYCDLVMQDIYNAASDLFIAASSALNAWNAMQAGNWNDFYNDRWAASYYLDASVRYFDEAQYYDDASSNLASYYFGYDIGQTADLYNGLGNDVYNYLYCGGSC